MTSRLAPAIVAALCVIVGLGVLNPGGVHLWAAEPAPAVKQSRSGICHSSASQHYAKLKEFQSFSNMQECIAAGGRPTRAAARKADGSVTESPAKPQNEQRPEKEKLAPAIPGAVWLVVAVMAVLVIALPWLSRWRLRQQNRKVVEAFEGAEDKRWRGHRLPPNDGPMSR